MPRLELWMCVFAGVSGGLAGSLWSGLVTTPWLARNPATAGLVLPESAARLVAGAVLRGGAGAVLGFLFWLGWGLIAVVGWPWHVVGLLYGGLCWAALVMPVLASLGLRVPNEGRLIAAHALEWLCTCAAIGLACAYAWHRYA
jgi:hypothetical protein